MQTIRSTKVINSGTAAQSLLSPAADAEPDTCARVGEQPELPAALRWQLLCRLLPVLTLGYGLSFIDRSNIAYAELEMGRAIGIDARTFGLASGIFFAGYGPMQIHLGGADVSRTLRSYPLAVEATKSHGTKLHRS